MKLQTCFTSTSEEQGQTCGQKMANDKDYLVVSRARSPSAVSRWSLDHQRAKPMVYGVAIGPPTRPTRPASSSSATAFRVSAPFGTFVSDVLKAKSTAVVWPQQPGIKSRSQAIVASLKAAGVSIKRVSWNPNATDLVGPLTAAGAQTRRRHPCRTRTRSAA